VNYFWRERGLAVAIPRVRYRALLPWAVVFAVGAIVAGPLFRSRGGRLPSQEALRDWGLGDAAPWLFLVLVLLVLGLSVWWWTRGRWATVWTVLLAAVFSWGISTHSVISRASPGHRPPTAEIYAKEPLQSAGPSAPIAVMVGRPSPNSRHYYEPAFRSDHRVEFIAPDAALDWATAHPDGFVLVWSKDKAPKLKVVARAKGWQAYTAWSSPDRGRPAREEP